ncbi:hypothetical protein BFS30_10135 [Pedobacter steynii]|uniref:Uncharacterized protein n=1 Tax=Pedobacter steynii TaxID=430522 RepID=A0A1D7QFU0_9SPHI|nr:hypothetical protein BFS30_10135 [Pedobacter steynii]
MDMLVFKHVLVFYKCKYMYLNIKTFGFLCKILIEKRKGFLQKEFLDPEQVLPELIIGVSKILLNNPLSAQF